MSAQTEEPTGKQFCRSCDMVVEGKHVHPTVPYDEMSVALHPESVVVGSGPWDYADTVSGYRLYHPRFIGGA